jgi:hypothetical protein
MLDLETLATNVHAPIIQIGACRFNMGTGDASDSFCTNVSFESQLRKGAVIDERTIVWWMFQSKEARESVFSDPVLSPTMAFKQVNEFLAPADAIWSHATFDFVILREAMRRHGVDPTFSYKTPKDIRTITHLAQMKDEEYDNMPSTGIKHNALDDCIYQARYVSLCYKKIKDSLNDYDNLLGKYKALQEKYREEIE